MSNIDWSKLLTTEMKEIAQKTPVEDAWRLEEIAFIADQLLAIEDGDSAALPGTERQWRDYRTAVRSWKTGHPDFPSIAFRPARPA